MIGVPGIALAARLGERDRDIPDGAPRGQLGAQHVQKTEERRPHPIDAVLGHLDDRPFAVAARLLGVQRVAPAGALGDRPQADLPARPAETARARAAHPRGGFVDRQQARVRGQKPPSCAARNVARPAGGGTPMAAANRRCPSAPSPGNSTASGSADTMRSSSPPVSGPAPAWRWI